MRRRLEGARREGELGRAVGGVARVVLVDVRVLPVGVDEGQEVAPRRVAARDEGAVVVLDGDPAAEERDRAVAVPGAPLDEQDLVPLVALLEVVVEDGYFDLLVRVAFEDRGVAGPGGRGSVKPAYAVSVL